MTTISFNGKLLNFTHPRVMGIINLTNDSFYADSRLIDSTAVIDQVASMINDGVSIIDLGAMSTRPSAAEICETEEWDRLADIISLIRDKFPDIFISLDSYRLSIMKKAVDKGVDMINDVSGGLYNDDISKYVGSIDIPYVWMHSLGRSDHMQDNPVYDDVVMDILTAAKQALWTLEGHGSRQVIIDPGFGFGKTISHNYEILKKLSCFSIFDRPIMAGISRKSMIFKVLDLTPSTSLNGTTALHMIALCNGAKILRVHDVKEAMDCITLWRQLN